MDSNARIFVSEWFRIPECACVRLSEQMATGGFKPTAVTVSDHLTHEWGVDPPSRQPHTLPTHAPPKLSPLGGSARRYTWPPQASGMSDLPWHASKTPQSPPVTMASSISAYFPNPSVRYSGEIETACAAIRSQ